MIVALSVSTYGVGMRHGQATGQANLEGLKAQHAEQQLTTERASHLQLRQQIERAQQSERLMYEQMARHTEQTKTRQDRIPHVTTRYLPAPDAKAQPVPRCVFTAGWLRDFNAALGMPSSTAISAHPAPAEATSATPGPDAELLESGITPADILAHANDYGSWVRQLAEQLNALLDLQQRTPGP